MIHDTATYQHCIHTAVEFPVNHWPELIEILLSFVNNQDNTILKIKTLRGIGFILDLLPISKILWDPERH